MAGENGKRSMEEILEEHLAVTKEQFKELRGEIAGLRTEFRGELTELRNDVNDGFRALRTEMIGGLAQVRKEMNAGFADVRAETAGLRKEMNAGFARSPWDNHEERIASLEADVAKLKAG